MVFHKDSNPVFGIKYETQFRVPWDAERGTRSNNMKNANAADTLLKSVLACPQCQGELTFAGPSSETSADEGLWRCVTCDTSYPSIRGVPRFLVNASGYVDNFGTQWNLFDGIQIDRIANHTLSESRLLGDTGWSPDWIHDKVILDAGCGAGRFSDVLAKHGAHVIACDLSSAVDACFNTCVTNAPSDPARGDVNVLQADLLRLPLKPESVDAIHCAGVIQHTPDPEAVMQGLIKYLKPGGKLFYNFYEVSPIARFQVFKYFMRRWTPDWPISRLHAFCRFLTAVFFVPSFIMAHIPLIRALNPYLPICSTHPSGVPIRQQYTMTLLDTIDWYGPVYEIRQNHRRVAELLSDSGLVNVTSDAGRAWARKPD